MSSPAFGFSPWRQARPSTPNTQDTQDDGVVSPGRSSSVAMPEARHLSSSFSSNSHREPIRSFIQGSVRDHPTTAKTDSVQNAKSVREDTAELASYLLSDKKSGKSPAFLSRQRSSSSYFGRDATSSDVEDDDWQASMASDVIVEDDEPESPESPDTVVDRREEGPSILSSLLRRSPPEDSQDPAQRKPSQTSINSSRDSHTRFPHSKQEAQASRRSIDEVAHETTPLLHRASSHASHQNGHGHNGDIEAQKPAVSRDWFGSFRRLAQEMDSKVSRAATIILHPQKWDRRAIWRHGFQEPAACLPAVVVGLLLNILDALSYGMILFPLGNPIFSGLGSAGISIFYVSTIISQLTFSAGSIFRGSVGSELIEVVPFFHNMAQKITDIVGEDQPDAVIATAIVSFSLSSMLTGSVFYLMGKFKFGYMVGFIPRHILIGCIGGVGWFLVQTGFEVSARLEGSLEYDLDTLQRLIQPGTLPLWIVPLALAIILFVLQARIESKYFLPLYIIAIPIIFYFFVFSLDALEPATLREGGWIFHGPPADEPWWYFWTLFKFHLVRWDAVVETVPAMLALTFFGVLHVPINVPALALSAGEDHADLDRELRLHGYSNFLSGLAGSVQNYLVYANTVFFMRSGGDSRLAGFMLAGLTFGVMTVGPSIIGYIPVMVVGTLIFVLGFELLLEAIWTPRKKLKLPEYLTVITIVLVMGIYDFVIGIGVGILLAFIMLVVQTSRVPAIRATFSGEIVGSTVRRNPLQAHYLEQVGRQIYMVKLTGFLFFGTIVSVEEKIRELLDDKAFDHSPIRYLILDMWHVTGLDYSAGQAFETVSRLLKKKDVVLVISGVDAESELGHDLRAVGLGGETDEAMLLPDLNSALESCENGLLKIFYTSQEALNECDSRSLTSPYLDVPKVKQVVGQVIGATASSPRLSHLQEAANNSLSTVEVPRASRWQSFKEPLRLMLQIFQGLSNKNEDFWFKAVGYFVRKEFETGTVLFHPHEPADGFYLIEQGMLRAEYNLPQGHYWESLVAGTTCGELPFFSETERTATVVAERDSVTWLMDKEGWERLQREAPEVAQELLRISLKLTSERMNAITSYVLAIAG